MMFIAQTVNSGIALGDAATWAGAVVAVFAAMFTVWWPWKNRPQPQWMPVNETDTNLRSSPKLSGFKGFFVDVNGITMHPDRILRVYNVGDGPAYGVMADEDSIVMEPGCDGVPGSRAATDYVASIQPGEFFFLVRLAGSVEHKESITLHWLATPTNRGRMYVQEIPVTESDFGRVPSPRLLCRSQTVEWKRNRPAPHRYVVPVE